MYFERNLLLKKINIDFSGFCSQERPFATAIKHCYIVIFTKTNFYF